jgi:hypothetical protein
VFLQDIISLSIRTLQAVPRNSTDSTNSTYIVAKNRVNKIIRDARQDGSLSTSLATYLEQSGSVELNNPTTLASVWALSATPSGEATSQPTGCSGTGPRIGSGCGGDVGGGSRVIPQTGGGARERQAGLQWQWHVFVLVVIVVVSFVVQQ